MKQFSLLATASVAAAGSIKDVEHIVLFMQENRAFDHYFVSPSLTSSTM